ncbi:PKD domain-containing protein [Tenggerimyces flavus]|uniref:PKD domain-containing protein n=1 Tax=Tenggerimyces flavus TaxID=1708749 RepID=A0ABV7YE69_9ACTN|nr:PKD domain-containing protein [Tenggerimyces flavus]MBM7783422.1 chitodextrinase [Tenggerimyces flavus]
MQRNVARALALVLITIYLHVVAVVATGGANAAVTLEDAEPAAVTAAAEHSVQLKPVGSLGPVDGGGLIAHCDTCVPDDLFDCGGCEVTAGIKIKAISRLDWANSQVPVFTVDPAEVRQGSTATVFNRMGRGEGEGLKLAFEGTYAFGIFVCGGDFKPCGDKGYDDWQETNEYTRTATKTMTAPTACTPQAGAVLCDFSTKIDGFVPETCFLPGCPVDLTVNLHADGQVQATKEGIVVARTATFNTSAGNVDAKKSVWAKAENVADEVPVPCTATPGSKLRYKVGAPALYAPDVAATGSLKFYLDIDGPGPLNSHTWHTLREGVLLKGSMNMFDHATAATYEVGTVLPDDVKPRITGLDQTGAFVEGSPVTFTAGAEDNCLDGLTYDWTFSDGTTASGKTVEHVFADNGTYNGTLVVSDAGGNVAEQPFDLRQPIENAAPVVARPADVKQEWGLPASFHAEATDPGPADQATLKYRWEFGDGTQADGADATHTYAKPGTYTAKVTVTDKDGASASAEVVATVTARATKTTYTGPRHSLPLLPINLSATVVDSQGKPVANAEVTFKIGGIDVQDRTDSRGRAAALLIAPLLLGDTTVAAVTAGGNLYAGSTDGPYPYRVGLTPPAIAAP